MVNLQAGSPDEAALVVAAKVFGFFFHARTLRGVKASHRHALLDDTCAKPQPHQLMAHDIGRWR